MSFDVVSKGTRISQPQSSPVHGFAAKIKKLWVDAGVLENVRTSVYQSEIPGPWHINVHPVLAL